MNMSFGLPTLKERGNKMKVSTKEITTTYEQKLEEYRNTLENYKKWLLEYSDKCEVYENSIGVQKCNGVQTAMDLTYIKEQGEKTMELMEDLDKVKINNIMLELEKLKAILVTTSDNLEGVDKNVVNRISELLIELQKQNALLSKQYQEEQIIKLQALDRRVQRGHALLWFVLAFNLIGISGIAFLILYILEIISF